MRRYTLPQRVTGYLLLMAAPAFAAVYRGDLDDHAADIASSADLVERQDHGRQMVFQMSEHAISDLVLAFMHTGGTELRWTPTTAEAASLGFQPDIWVSNLAVELSEDETLIITASLEGRFDAQRGPYTTTCTIGFGTDPDGSAVIEMPLSLESDTCGGPSALTGVPTVDTVDLDLSSCVDAIASQEVAIEAGLRTQLEASLTGFSIDLSPVRDLISEEAFVCEDEEATGLHLPDLRPQNVSTRTLMEPLDEQGDVTEPLIMVGMDILSDSAVGGEADCTEDTGVDTSCGDTGASTVPGLPDCYEDLVTAGTYTLFHEDAFDSYNQSLIGQNRDLTLALSTRLLRRLQADLVWQAEVDGQRLSVLWPQQLQRAEDAKGSVRSHDEYTEWTGFTTHYPIIDTIEPLCAIDAENSSISGADDAVTAEGGWVLDASELDPELHAHAQMHHRYCLLFFCTDTHVSVDIHSRYYIDNADPSSPILSQELDFSSRNDAGCGSRCSGEAESTDAMLTRMRESIGRGTTQFFELQSAGDHYSIDFDLMETYQATVLISGELSTTLTDDDDLSYADADVTPGRYHYARNPPVGAIAALNLDSPADRLAIAGFDPIQRECAPGFRSRYLDLSATADVVISACEYVDSANAGSVTELPPLAWCGLSAAPEHHEEVCDHLDNDGNGLVDDDLGDENADGVADCFEECLAGAEECNGADDDGNGSIDEGFTDADGDGAVDCLADCPPQEDPPSLCDGIDPRDGCPSGFTQYGLWFDTATRFCLNLGTCSPAIADADVVTCLADGSAWTTDMAADLPENLTVRAYFATASQPYSGRRRCRSGFSSDTQTAESLVGLTLTQCVATGDDMDEDWDGLGDIIGETVAGTSGSSRSTDGDAFNDGFEANVVEGLDPNSEDSDDDELTDVTEVFVTGTDPTVADTDEDGLSDGFEVWVSQTDPLDADDDDDGVLDGDEDSVADLLLTSTWYTDVSDPDTGATTEGSGFDTGGGYGMGE